MRFLTASFAIIFSLLITGLSIASQSSIELKHSFVRLAYAPMVHTSYYPVQGNTIEELKNSMFERGPIGFGGHRYFAYTFWYMRYAASNRQIATTSVRKLHCSISVHLPFLYSDKKQSLDIKNRWKSFMNKLIEHESRHVQNARRVCYSLKIEGQNKIRFNLISKRLTKRDELYDLKTAHGTALGAKLI